MYTWKPWLCQIPMVSVPKRRCKGTPYTMDTQRCQWKLRELSFSEFHLGPFRFFRSPSDSQVQRSKRVQWLEFIDREAVHGEVFQQREGQELPPEDMHLFRSFKPAWIWRFPNMEVLCCRLRTGENPKSGRVQESSLPLPAVFCRGGGGGG